MFYGEKRRMENSSCTISRAKIQINDPATHIYKARKFRPREREKNNGEMQRNEYSESTNN